MVTSRSTTTAFYQELSSLGFTWSSVAGFQSESNRTIRFAPTLDSGSGGIGERGRHTRTMQRDGFGKGSSVRGGGAGLNGGSSETSLSSEIELELELHQEEVAASLVSQSCLENEKYRASMRGTCG